MANGHEPIRPEDYAEPRCPLGMETYGSAPEVISIPQQRVMEKMDDYMSRRDYEGAERHLLYWLREAQLGNDLRGELMVSNELVGHYRKVGNQEEAYAHGERVLALLAELDFQETISAGTSYVNVATAHNAFGDNEEALRLFQKAKDVYEANENTAPQLLGGLYNNMALVYAALGRYEESRFMYQRAIALMGQVENGELEQAISYLNLANALEDEHGMEAAEEKIFDCVDKAYELLNKPETLRNGYYAFVCEKCAPSFSYYGYFAAAEELTKRAEEIYGRTDAE